MAPLRFATDRELAYKRVRALLAAEDGTELIEAESAAYLHALLSSGDQAEEDLELHFLERDPVVTFRLLARTPSPMQPFCVSRGCVNGNQAQRKRIQELRDSLGWRSDDASFDNEKFDGWVPIFMH